MARVRVYDALGNRVNEDCGSLLVAVSTAVGYARRATPAYVMADRFYLTVWPDGFAEYRDSYGEVRATCNVYADADGVHRLGRAWKLAEADLLPA